MKKVKHFYRFFIKLSKRHVYAAGSYQYRTHENNGDTWVSRLAYICVVCAGFVTELSYFGLNAKKPERNLLRFFVKQ